MGTLGSNREWLEPVSALLTSPRPAVGLTQHLNSCWSSPNRSVYFRNHQARADHTNADGHHIQRQLLSEPKEPCHVPALVACTGASPMGLAPNWPAVKIREDVTRGRLLHQLGRHLGQH